MRFGRDRSGDLDRHAGVIPGSDKKENMNADLTIRAAMESDKAPIWRLYEDALRHHIEVIWGWDTAWQQDYFDKAFMRLTTRVVEVDGRFAGYVQVDTAAEEDYLSMLILHPDARRRGLGARLLSALQAESRREGRGLYLRVFRTNAAARRFYEREGWAVVADEGDFLVMRPGAGAH
jgi:ribosomal protein S18 acetylase RimI-like enzyme